jgi:hypothetical protein
VRDRRDLADAEGEDLAFCEFERQATVDLLVLEDGWT